jgi:hypothetical protein
MYAEFFLEGRVEGERPLQTHRQIWYVDSKMYLKEIEWNAGGWAHWAQEIEQCQTFVKTRMSLTFPYNAGILLTH